MTNRAIAKTKSRIKKDKVSENKPGIPLVNCEGNFIFTQPYFIQLYNVTGVYAGKSTPQQFLHLLLRPGGTRGRPAQFCFPHEPFPVHHVRCMAPLGKSPA